MTTAVERMPATRGAKPIAMRGSTSATAAPADAAALERYADFCGTAVLAPTQHPVWIKAWVKATAADGLVLALSLDGRPALMLALEVVRKGPFRIARFMGGDHANGNFPAVLAEAAASLTSADLDMLMDAIRDARPDIDIVELHRQNHGQGGLRNPLMLLPQGRSPNVSLAADLDGGFDALLERASGKRKRKKYRLALRKFDEAGGHRLIEAATPGETERLLSEFFVMKAERFRKKGIPDVFAAPEIKAFFHALFRDALAEPSPPFVLHAVEVGGVLRAVNGLSIGSDRVICDFGGIREDELINASPGFFLDYSNVEQACQSGAAIYDFSVGDEDYKRSWCDLETWQFDNFVALSAKGAALRQASRLRSRIVGFVKSNERLWSFVKRLRKGVAGRTSDQPTE
ncbi:GNAT family N-acetyltransferase [Aquamicrobium sp. LC103]|uniref:GNAT family N-acetyltransferase n=1 Tax=Aquamicrobium sp. LC103 TaxID=1120658 RepID=UPI001484DF77|nr:GNAT family N-acetyltransferase [Aquamicrobium sp. LC103]